jgi:hypothetical protein
MRTSLPQNGPPAAQAVPRPRNPATLPAQGLSELLRRSSRRSRSC